MLNIPIAHYFANNLFQFIINCKTLVKKQTIHTVCDALKLTSLAPL